MSIPRRAGNPGGNEGKRMKALLMCYEEFPRSGGKRARATWWRDSFNGWKKLARKPSQSRMSRALEAGELYEVPGSGDCSTLPASLARLARVLPAPRF